MGVRLRSGGPSEPSICRSHALLLARVVERHGLPLVTLPCAPRAPIICRRSMSLAGVGFRLARLEGQSTCENRLGGEDGPKAGGEGLGGDGWCRELRVGRRGGLKAASGEVWRLASVRAQRCAATGARWQAVAGVVAGSVAEAEPGCPGAGVGGGLGGGCGPRPCARAPPRGPRRSAELD